MSPSVSAFYQSFWQQQLSVCSRALYPGKVDMLECQPSPSSAGWMDREGHRRQPGPGTWCRVALPARGLATWSFSPQLACLIPTAPPLLLKRCSHLVLDQFPLFLPRALTKHRGAQVPSPTLLLSTVPTRTPWHGCVSGCSTAASALYFLLVLNAIPATESWGSIDSGSCSTSHAVSERGLKIQTQLLTQGFFLHQGTCNLVSGLFTQYVVHQLVTSVLL